MLTEDQLTAESFKDSYFWNDDVLQYCTEHDDAILYAEEWLEEESLTRTQPPLFIELDEVRPPSHEDFPVDALAQQICDDIQYWLDADGDFFREDIDGRPTFPDHPDKLTDETREKLLEFCRAAVHEIDLSEAAWQSTGRSMKVWRDGKVAYFVKFRTGGK